jgi:hypothetical protein
MEFGERDHGDFRGRDELSDYPVGSVGRLGGPSVI